MSILQAFILSLFIALIAIESRIFTSYIGRPIVMGPLLGFLLGDLQTGMIVGGSVELLFIGNLSIGAYYPPDSYLGGMLATVFAIQANDPAVGIALAYPIAIAGQLFVMLATTFNTYWTQLADKFIAQGNAKKVGYCHIAGALTFYVVYFTVAFVALAFGGELIINLYTSAPKWFITGLQRATGLLPAIGLAALLITMDLKKYWAFMFLGFVGAAYLKLNVIAITLLGLVFAGVLLLVNKKEEQDNTDLVKKVGSLTKKDLKKVFYRSFLSMCSFNYNRYNSLAFCYAMIPGLRKFYKDEDRFIDSMKRNNEFYNSHPYPTSIIIGVQLALEEQYASNPESISAEAISATKVALMGPLAGIGDSFFQVTLRVIFTTIGVAMVLSGNVLGVFVYYIPRLIQTLWCHWYFLKYGYEYGTQAVAKIKGSNLFDQVIQGASIVGMSVVTALIVSFVAFPTTIYWEKVVKIIDGKTGQLVDSIQKVNLQTMLDGVLPSLLPIIFVFICYKILKKNPRNGVYITLALAFLIGFVGVIVKFF